VLALGKKVNNAFSVGVKASDAPTPLFGSMMRDTNAVREFD